MHQKDVRNMEELWDGHRSDQVQLVHSTLERSKIQKLKILIKIDKLTKIVFEAEVGSQKPLEQNLPKQSSESSFQNRTGFCTNLDLKKRNTTKLWPEPILIVAFSFLISSCPRRKSTN